MSNEFDFSEAGSQRSTDLIPPGTQVDVHLTVRPGSAGPDGWMKRSKDGASLGLDCEFTVIAGEYTKKKIWGLFTMSGTTPGHETAGKISASKIRAMLESARGVRPDDMSPAAIEARKISSFEDLNDLRFCVKINIQKATEEYAAKNILGDIVTPDKRTWHAITQIDRGPATNPATRDSAPVAVPAKPAWAN